MAYSPSTWVNDSSTGPFISATNLNKLEAGVDESHKYVDALGGSTGVPPAAIGAANTFPMSGGTNFTWVNSTSLRATIAAQPLDTDLTTIATIAQSVRNFLFSNGSSWVAAKDQAARTQLGIHVQSTAPTANATNDIWVQTT